MNPNVRMKNYGESNVAAVAGVMPNAYLRSFVGVAALALLGACGAGEPAESAVSVPAAAVAATDTADAALAASRSDSTVAQFGTLDQAYADIEARSGSAVSGRVVFEPSQGRDSMQISVKLEGLQPGPHGFHIHQIGDCSADDASSAGGHFNPFNGRHGKPGDSGSHSGDLGNITANSDGTVDAVLNSDTLSFSGPGRVLNRAVVVHAAADDLATDPAGAAGSRVACGVVMAVRDTLVD